MSDPFRTLLEIQHLRGILLESRLDFLKGKYLPLLGPRLLDREMASMYGDYNDLLHAIQMQNPSVPSSVFWEHSGKPKRPTEAIVEMAFNWIVSLDPDIHKKNAQWLLDTFLVGEWIPEDGYKATKILNLYNRVKHNLPVEQRDLRLFKSLSKIYRVIQPYEAQESTRVVDKKLDAEMHQQADIIYNGPDYKILIPKTQEASCYFGRNTQWCTAAKVSHNAFERYAQQGPLYIVIDKKNNKRWQFHFGSYPQFMDETDAPIDFSKFNKEHPKVNEVLLPIILKQDSAKIITQIELENAFVGLNDMTTFNVSKGPAKHPGFTRTSPSRYYNTAVQYRLFNTVFGYVHPFLQMYVDLHGLMSILPEATFRSSLAPSICKLLNDLRIKGFSRGGPSPKTGPIEWDGNKFVPSKDYRLGWRPE